jgi:HEPN domain-containing protein
MDKAEEVRQWFAIADSDLSVSEHLLAAHNPRPDEIICFHCQQAGEKYLKGYLRIHDVEFPKIHDLVAIRKLCEKVYADFSRLAIHTQFLTQYGVLPKYPSELQMLPEDAETAIRYAREIKAFVAAQRNREAGG